ncbi:S-DNA-T family DNA segregation ATPase FtsK/SpoIIIE [Actinoplanes lutulentus]|uniref:S-DNA-T family DNA segregation ATPase FtsK/SpoIIIE n=1 Tax=Actinoplanes lutulentus TaxID=1287878 RepID=A0A327ZEN2_9ACTN|nr:FtsK/SpoIIIE domain-containing protein [Actinoplanes lutulentus]MBB2941816.1 S-DNA-T family DNA segregation ATPase FtsK/SpoIIIE [Actinoplanes lutulentus]RAK39735.1 S-DNA-T family DNA segregation ATPase FtsK/SpoIIIE [Actinoplanes lutulentus]
MSIFDPLFIGIDEFGHAVNLSLIYRNILIGGEPGAGKSSLLNTVVGHAALCYDTDLVLIDGKQVELGLWRDCADVFVGPNLDHAIDTLERLQAVMDNRYTFLLDHRRQKIEKADDIRCILLAIDELAYFSATVGTETEQKYFSALNRDIAARGRAVGIIDASATQRPSSDIIPTSLRFLFGWRWAGRCVDDSSSDVVLGHGWAAKNFSAARIDPNNRGEGLLLAHGGVPMSMKGAHMSNTDIIRVADYAACIRRGRAELVAEMRAAA